MATPYVKLSGDEVREQIRKNRDSGETEPGAFIELDLPSEEPQYVELTAEQKSSISESWTKLLEPSVSVDKPVEAIEREYKTYEFVSSMEEETKVEKSEFLIGDRKEISNFNIMVQAEQPKVDQVEDKVQDTKEAVNDKAPSALSEFGVDINFKKLGKKTFGLVFGLLKGFLGGLVGTVKESTKVEHKKTKEQIKADNKKKEQNAEKAAFHQRTEKALAEAQASKQNMVSKVLVRLGVAGMGTDMLNSYLGKNRNLNSEEINVYTAFEIAKKAEEAKRAQEKQVKDIEMTETSKPAVNIDAAVEGGTGGGQANISAVASAG